MNRSYPVLLLALSLPALSILVGSAQGAVLRDFDWNTPPDPNGPNGCAVGPGQFPCGDWALPPWNSGYNQGSLSAGFTYFNSTGQINNFWDEIFPGGPKIPTFMAMGENTAPPGGDPNAILNLDLVTFSFDAMRDGSVTFSDTFRGLGFYPYDLIKGDVTPDTSPGLGAFNQGVLPWQAPNGGVNTNFLSISLFDRDPDTFYHYDVVINASGASVGSGANEVPHFHWMVFLDGEPLWTIDDPDPNLPAIQYTLEDSTRSPGGYGIDPNGVVLEGAGIDGWQFKSFHEGLWFVDNFQVRDEFFVQSAGIPGDFDGNGHVDGLDFLLWQRDPGVGSLADWEANYGTWALVAAVSSVPEPTGAALLMLAGSLAFLGRRPPPRDLIPRNLSEG